MIFAERRAQEKRFTESWQTTVQKLRKIIKLFWIFFVLTKLFEDQKVFENEKKTQ